MPRAKGTHGDATEEAVVLLLLESSLIEATARGFEPLRAEPNGFRVHLLSRSDTLSSGYHQLGNLSGVSNLLQHAIALAFAWSHFHVAACEAWATSIQVCVALAIKQAGYSSVGRASDCRDLQQSDGPWFDSGWPDLPIVALP